MLSAVDEPGCRLQTRGVALSRLQVLGLARLTIGLGLAVAPRQLSGSSDPSSALLVRTVGIRDLVLGAGTVLAERDDAELWGIAALTSDTLDVVAGLAAVRSIGARGGLTAALIPLPFIALGLWALRGPSRPPVG